MRPRPLSRLMSLLAAPDRQRRLAEAALLLAAADYPDLDVDAHLAQLQQHAEVVRRRLPSNASSLDVIQLLNTYLFGELQWAGNAEDYYDPRNSYLHEVMARGTGIPITLSILYIDIARRLGLRVSGVAFPGHFMAQVETASANWVIDVFAGGQLLDRAALEERLLRVVSDRAQLGLSMQQWLRPAEVGAILLRMLANLRAIYVQREEWHRALVCCDRALLISPDNVPTLGERAKLFERLNRPLEAQKDYERMLQLEGPHELQREAAERLGALGKVGAFVLH